MLIDSFIFQYQIKMQHLSKMHIHEFRLNKLKHLNYQLWKVLSYIVSLDRRDTCDVIIKLDIYTV